MRQAAAAVVAWLLGTAGPPALAGTTGTISGKVTASDGSPIVAATVVLVGQRLGAYSDAQGRYRIAKVPPGTYELQVTRLNYETVRVQGVLVTADQNTTQDVSMKDETLETEEVVVVAKRPPVDLKLTSTQSNVTREEIEALPVQELEDIVNLQAGVVEGHFRGGRIGEVQYQVDGVSVNDPYDNESALTVDRSVLQEVQVISGTFDAEYGQAMSGVVNAVLKQGTENPEWDAEVYAGGYFYQGGERRPIDEEIRPLGTQSYSATVSGPLPLANTVFLASGRRYEHDDYVYGTRTFRPSDEGDFENKVFTGTGDGERVPLGFTREWSGLAKLTNTFLPKTKLNYQVLFHLGEGRGNNYRFRLNPDGQRQNTTVAVQHGFDITQTLSSTSFLDVSLRQNYSKYDDWRWDSAFDPRYDQAGPPLGDPNYELGAYVQGADFGRFRQRTMLYQVKVSYVNQVDDAHRVKGGVEFLRPSVKFGVPGHLVFTTVDGAEQLVRHFDEPPDYPGIATYNPHIGAAYLQDQAEWPGLTIRFGARLDYFDARSHIPGDLANPANAIEGAPESGLQRTSKKVYLSPRLGVAYPIEDYAALHFSYGHFRQFPPIGAMFSNADYTVLANLQAGTSDFGVLGNPDVRPEETVQYEAGYKHAFSEDLGVDVTTFYKDIRDLLGVEFINTYNNAEYARLTNVDFGDIFGFTLALDDKALGPLSVAADYTWQRAMGNSSDPRETATRAEAGEDPRPRLVPLNWDQRHTFNATVSLTRPQYSVSAVIRVASGQPYTPELGTGFGEVLQTNSGRKPSGFLMDLRSERALGVWQGAEVALFARAFNVFDQRFFNGAVFASTGDPYYSRNPVADEVALADPTRYYPPRRIEMGLRLGGSGAVTEETP